MVNPESVKLSVGAYHKFTCLVIICLVNINLVDILVISLRCWSLAHHGFLLFLPSPSKAAEIKSQLSKGLLLVKREYSSNPNI